MRKLTLKRTTIRNLGGRAELERVVGGISAGAGCTGGNTIVVCIDTNAQTNCGPNCPATGLGCNTTPQFTFGC